MARPKKVVEEEVLEEPTPNAPSRLNSDLQEVLDRQLGTYKKA